MRAALSIPWSLLLCACAGVAPAAEIAALTLQAFSAGAIALVNPSLQPFDLYERYVAVLSLEVVSVDADKRTMVLAVRHVLKGDFAARTITVNATAEAVAGAFQLLPEPGLAIVAFVGKGKRGATDVLFYAGGEGQWQIATVRASGDAATSAAWDWTEVLKEEMFGTFNGHPAQLGAMLRDHAAGRGFFPAQPFTHFRADLVLGKLAGPIAGVALYDLDSDGRPDALATSPTGCALFLQRAPLTFADATVTAGLSGVAGRSVSITDVDGDGRADLLIDGRILRQDAVGHFVLTTLLPTSADRGVVMSAFADFDHDGFPDVLVSQDGSGLHAWRHPGASGGPYVDLTATIGLDRPENGAGQSGFFSFGDLHGDRHDGVFLAVGGGLLLERQATGAFAPVTMPAYDFTVPTGARTGGGAMGNVYDPTKPTLVFANDRGVNLVDAANGTASDVGRYGNETVVITESCQALIAEDLHASGNLDLYAISRSPSASNTLYVNRGYGSFMVSTRYKADAIPGTAHQRGAGGVAAGDADGDGANDLLLGGVDGRLVLLVNAVLADRGTDENPNRQNAVLARTALLAVTITGPRGVVGARVTVLDPHDRVVAERIIGGNAATGCRGPDVSTLAIREPGDYRVRVQWSDGHQQILPVTLAAKQLTALHALRP
jgi:hypothetical protein